MEQGSLDLDTPVDTYRPEFAEVKVLAGFDGDTPRLRAPASRATVRHLITHTSGLAYWFWNEDIAQYEKVVGLPNVVPGRLDAFKAPMVAEPGTRFVYGINTSWLGRVVEAVTGKGLRRTAILQPPSPRSSRRPGSWNESSEEQRIRNLFERVETIEEVAVTLPQGDDRRTRLLALSRDALAEEATVRPVIAAKILGLSEKTVRAWADGGLLATTQRYPPTLP